MEAKDVLIVQAIEDTIAAIEDMQRNFNSLETFIRDNFRNYNNYFYSGYNTHLQNAKGKLEGIRSLASTNADNAHRLEQTEESQESHPPQQQQYVPRFSTYYRR